MGGKHRRCLTENAVPTVFIFPETKNKRMLSIKRAEKAKLRYTSGFLFTKFACVLVCLVCLVYTPP